MSLCVVPEARVDEVGDKRWESMHNRYVSETKTEEPEVLFIGDSIIQQLQLSTLWNEKINSLHCLNFGIGGDRVEHVLWRIQNGELEFSFKIKAAVLLVGTNNTDCMAKYVFDGIVEIVKAIKNKLNDCHILILTLLPRGQFPNKNRSRNMEVNSMLLEKFSGNSGENAETKNVQVLAIHEQIVQSDDTISHHVMHDYLHLTNYGYTKIFGPVYDKLCEILEKP